MRTRQLALLITCLLVGGGCLTATATARSSLPRLLDRYPAGNDLGVRPAVVNYSNDGSGAFGGAGGRNGVTDPGRLRWRSWTSKRAVGHGVDWIKSCVPDCAAGTWHAYGATLIASDPKRGVFRKLTDHEVYHGRRVTIVWKIYRYGPSWDFEQTYPQYR